jgi:hypothetical protein
MADGLNRPLAVRWRGGPPQAGQVGSIKGADLIRQDSRSDGLFAGAGLRSAVRGPPGNHRVWLNRVADAARDGLVGAASTLE